MTRIRWALLVVGVVAIAAGGATAVLAGSSAYVPGHVHAATFWSNGDPAAMPGQDGNWNWLRTTAAKAVWTFDAGDLQSAIRTSVFLNFAGLSTNATGGSGFSDGLKVVVAGKGSATYSATLANPWRPHIASYAYGEGWDATAAVNVPSYLWLGASTLTVTVTPVTSGVQIGMNDDALLIGYAD